MDERRRVLESFRASGLSQADFCEQEGLSRGTLQNWLYRKDEQPPTKFVTVTKASRETVVERESIEIRVGDVAIVLQQPVEPSYLAMLVVQLEQERGRR